LFSTFFAWWWAAIAGFASIASFLSWPEGGITVGRLAFSISLLAALTLIFLVLSLTYRAWEFYQGQFASPRFLGIKRSAEYGGTDVFLLGQVMPVLAQGTLVQLHRYHNGVQCLAAVLEVMDRNALNQYQAKPIWVAPGHLRDFRTNVINVTDVYVQPYVCRRALETVVQSGIGG
jgi:hypothetical protein